MARWLADENFHGPTVRGLLHRQPTIDLILVQDVGLGGVDDPGVLDWAARHDRIVLTHDRQTMAGFAYDRIAAGEPMPGLFVVDNLAPIRQVIDDLLLIESGSTHEEWADRVEYVPL
jgi:predicted nuclease of predicted toxin-antitoxin system